MLVNEQAITTRAYLTLTVLALILLFMRLATPPCHLQALDNISAFPSISNFVQWGLIQVRPASLLPASTVHPSQRALHAHSGMPCAQPAA